MQEAADTVRRGRSTLEIWIRNWNQNGVEGLKPRFSGGPKPKLPKTEWDKIVEEIENKAMTIKDVAIYVKNTRGVSYTYKGVWEMLRRKRHLRYGKPYKMNKKRPQDAEAIFLKKRLHEAFLKMGQTFKGDLEPIVGFADESSLSSDPSRRRVINTPVARYSEGDGKKRSWTMFGFLALNGKDVVMVSEKAKAPNMMEFLDLVREENGGSQCDNLVTRPIIMLLDNARIHIASSVKEKAEALQIEGVYLPPYSPDLMPIEFGWKDVKRELSTYFNFDDALYAAKETTLNLFSQRKYSYSKHWIRSFICPNCS